MKYWSPRRMLCDTIHGGDGHRCLLTSSRKLMTDQSKVAAKVQLCEQTSFIVVLYRDMGEELFTGAKVTQRHLCHQKPTQHGWQLWKPDTRSILHRVHTPCRLTVSSPGRVVCLSLFLEAPSLAWGPSLSLYCLFMLGQFRDFLRPLSLLQKIKELPSRMEYFPLEYPILQTLPSSTITKMDTFGYRKRQIRSAVVRTELRVSNFMCVLALVTLSLQLMASCYLEITQGKSERRGSGPPLPFVS